jgi:tripartite-type tricarboxylate transporter receptor subunit TctC
MRRSILALIALTVLAGGTSAQEPSFPSRSIRIIVPFAGGSGSDITSRYYAEKLSAVLGQTVFVENKPGADGALGMLAAKAAPADGYTMVLSGITTSVVNAVLVKDMKYDPVKDFKPVFGHSRNMNVVIVADDSNIRTLADLKQASSGAGLNGGIYSATLRLTAEWMAGLMGVKFNLIPYKGQGQIQTEIIGRQLDFALVDVSGAASLIQSGKFRAVAVTGEERSPVLPNIPTIRESGYPGLSQYSWNAFYVRSDVPDAVTEKLAQAVKTVMSSEETKAMVRSRGSEQVALSPADMKRMQIAEIERFKRVAAQANILPQ